MCYLKRYGTYDLVGKDSIIFQYVLDNIINVCDLYN